MLARLFLCSLSLLGCLRLFSRLLLGATLLPTARPFLVLTVNLPPHPLAASPLHIYYYAHRLPRSSAALGCALYFAFYLMGTVLVLHCYCSSLSSIDHALFQRLSPDTLYCWGFILHSKTQGSSVTYLLGAGITLLHAYRET